MALLKKRKARTALSKQLNVKDLQKRGKAALAKMPSREEITRAIPTSKKELQKLAPSRKDLQKLTAKVPVGRRKPPPSKAEQMKVPALILGGVAAGAALTYFLDPDRGKARRARARDRTAAAARRTASGARRLTTRAGNKVQGIRHRAGDIQPKDLNDATLAHKVESEVIRRPGVPKGRINVNAENGKVVLRGECDNPDQITEIESTVRQIPEVLEVENLLHVRGTPAPQRT